MKGSQEKLDIKNMYMRKIGILLVPHPRTKVHSYISLEAKSEHTKGNVCNLDCYTSKICCVCMALSLVSSDCASAIETSC